MAFPTVQTTAETAVTTAGTSHAITLPSGISAGDLILILMDIGSTSATLSAHADYEELLDESAANGLKILYRWATGGESNPTFTSSGSTRSATIAYRISGAEHPDLVAPQIGTTATGTSTTPDPPSVTPSGGTQDYLFIAFFGGAGEEADDDTWVNSGPTNYTNLLQKACGTAGSSLGGKIGSAERQLNTGSAQDPGTFNQDVNTAWRAQHICIHPSSGTATVKVREFDGVDDAIVLLPGNVGSASGGPFSFAALIKRQENADNAFVSIGNAYTTSSASFGHGKLTFWAGNTTSLGVKTATSDGDNTSGLLWTQADNWVLLVATKASGTVTPRYHKYVLDTDTVTRDDADIARAATAMASTDRIVFGKDEFSNRFNCRIAVAAYWDVELSDSQVDELYANLATQDWYDNTAGSPLALWDFNQATVADDVLDLMGSGADESAIAGTRVREDPLVWTYGVTVAAQSLIWQPAPPSLYLR
jgi:hypothetical protein